MTRVNEIIEKEETVNIEGKVDQAILIVCSLFKRIDQFSTVIQRNQTEVLRSVESSFLMFVKTVTTNPCFLQSLSENNLIELMNELISQLIKNTDSRNTDDSNLKLLQPIIPEYTILKAKIDHTSLTITSINSVITSILKNAKLGLVFPAFLEMMTALRRNQSYINVPNPNLNNPRNEVIPYRNNGQVLFTKIMNKIIYYGVE